MPRAHTRITNSAAHSAPHPAGRPARARLVRSGLAAATLVAGLSACGGGGDEPIADAAPAVTDAPVSDSSATESPVTEPGIEAPVVTDAPVADEANLGADAAAAVEMTPELATFRDENSALVDAWSDQLAAFGNEAFEYIDDVSRAPAAPATKELSDELVAAIGTDTADPGLVTMRDFATGMSTAVTHSVDGDQDAALTVFLELQAGQQQLAAVLDVLRG